MPRLYDLPDSEKICKCGCELIYIKDEKSEQLKIIPAKIYVIEHTRKKYACKKCNETIKLAKQPIAAAAIFNIIETCKHHKIEPHDYLRYVLNILPQCQIIEDDEKLLPYKIDKSLLTTSVN